MWLNIGAPAHFACLFHSHEIAFLIQRLTGELKPQMPLGGIALPEEEIAIIERWILKDALNN